MAYKKYELSSVYVRVLPSLAGLNKALLKEFNKTRPELEKLGSVLGDSFTKNLGKKLSEEVKKATSAAEALGDATKDSVDGVGEKLKKQVEEANRPAAGIGGIIKDSFKDLGPALSKTLKVSGSLLTPLRYGVTSTAKFFGKGLRETVAAAAPMISSSLAAAVGAGVGQFTVGGFNRAIDLNSAEAKLKALGYQGAEFASIMKSASDAVDGTAFSLSDSVGSTATLLAAGIKPGQELTGILKNIAKTSDITGRSFQDMGSIFAKNAAAGVVQMDDLNQLIDSGLPITAVLAKNLGKSVAEIKKMASAGQITFTDLNNAINSIDFDSALLASKDISLAFRNVRSQVSKLGQNLWTPIIDGLLPIFIDTRKILINLGKVINFNPIQTKIADFMKDIRKPFDGLKNAAGEIDKAKIGEKIEDIINKFKTFKSSIKGLEGPIVGTMVGISGSLLSTIPIIGPAFANITPLAGLFGGTLFQAYKDSEKLQDSVKKLSPFISKLGGAFMKSTKEGGDFTTSLGDNIADFMNSTMDKIVQAVETISSRSDEIESAFEKVKKVFKEAFKSEGLEDINFGDLIVDSIVLAADYISTVVPLIVNAAKLAGDVITSDAFKGFFTWLIDIAKYVLDNEKLLIGLGASLGAIFIGGKLIKGISAMTGIFSKVKVPAGAAGKSTGIIAGIKSSQAVVSAAGSAAIALIIPIGKLALGVAGITAIISLLGALLGNSLITGGISMFGDFLYTTAETIAKPIKAFADTLGQSYDEMVTRVMPILEQLRMFFTDTFASYITTVGGAVEQAMKSIENVFKTAIETAPAMIDSFGGLIGKFRELLVTLDEKGFSAGAGAYSAAGGITALMAAISGGAAAAGFTNLAASALEGVSGKADPLTQVKEALGALSTVNTEIANMQNIWPQIANNATLFGSTVPLNIANGMRNNQSVMEITFTDIVKNMIDQAQAYLDSNPLVARFDMDTNMPSDRTAGSGSSTTNNYNNSSSFNVNTNNVNYAKQLERDARF